MGEPLPHEPVSVGWPGRIMWSVDPDRPPQSWDWSSRKEPVAVRLRNGQTIIVRPKVKP